MKIMSVNTRDLEGKGQKTLLKEVGLSGSTRNCSYLGNYGAL
jgi:hypothetical protein